MARWSLAVALNLLGIAASAPNGGKAYTNFATELHHDLDASGYDKSVVARSFWRMPNPFASLAGTDVRFLLRLYKVIDVRPYEGLMVLRVQLVLAWQDTRLGWDPAEYGNITSTHYPAASTTNPEDSVIW